MAFDFWNTFGPGALGNLFGGGDPSEDANKYLGDIPGRTKPYFDPYIQQGQRVGGMLEGQYGNLLSDPGSVLNRFGQGYQQSPGFEFALKRALEGANRGAAAGGMAGSPMAQEQNMGIATQMANQDYMNWLDRTLGLYGRGMGGAENMYGKGFQASQSMADMIAQMLAAQSGLSYAGQASRNAGLGGLIGGGAGLLFGGPMGGIAGSAIGSKLGNFLG